VTRDREGDLERICQEALELPVAERANFLVEACGGDEGLRREAEALLAHDGAASSFLATPAMAMAARELDAGPALAVGQQFGPYTIVSRLGAGGMGEVYRARDPTLRRDVAIKVLPTLFTGDPERLSRFEREAQLLASLNHPNIATIHGLEHVDGIHALVLEVVEGETLAERLQSAASGSPRHRSRSHGDDGRSRAGLPLAEALTIAQQIAGALEAAHEQGVIHRDLKPANIMLRPDGVVKVLDFGLAKAAARDASAADTQAPTLSGGPTREGVILGTAAYMSPEQARGQAVDKRTDIWAFGCVLYEMLTGQGPFAGPTVTDTLAAILEREPNWDALPTLHPRIHELLRRCLEKDPNKRRRDIGDVRMDIEHVLSGPGQPAAPLVGRVSNPRTRLAWMVATVLVVALAAVVARLYFSGTSGTPETRVDISTPEAPDPTAFAISPDGRRLVFVAFRNGQTQLFLRSLDGDSTQPLSGTEAAILPFWSPDGHSVGFFALQELKRIDIDGGRVQTLARALPGPGGAWGPDGAILFAPVQMGLLFQVPASGVGEPVAVTRLGAGQSAHWSPLFLPGGRQFLFYANGTGDARGIYLGSLDSPDTTRLTDADTSGAFAPSGWLLLARQGALVARRFDPARRTLSGDPVTVAESVALGFFARAAVSVSATGTIAYRTGVAKASQLTWFDRTGRAVGTLGEPSPASPWNVALSRDGLRAAVERAGANGTDIWIIDSRGTTPFTADTPGQQRFPLWSPDGTTIAYANATPDGVYERASNGTGGGELLVTPRKILSDWSRDGRFLLYFEVDNKTRTDLWVLPVVGDRKPRSFLSTDSNEQWGQFSPNGRWIAYQSNESGQFEIYVRPFPGPGGRWTVSTSGGIHPRWSPDGKELFFLAPDARLTSAEIVVTGPTIEPGVPVPLFPTRIVGGGGNLAGYRQQYDVAPDGRFLINVGLESDPPPIRLLSNWKPRE
jgi:serine/threonine protein kinase